MGQGLQGLAEGVLVRLLLEEYQKDLITELKLHVLCSAEDTAESFLLINHVCGRVDWTTTGAHVRLSMKYGVRSIRSRAYDN